ncbi:hypothetical protein ON010_g9589 [Phytophthora cinnamomi]|nr:hypothetical protein ON010_g9589 [Phytophthora cinnamomi]
MDQPPLPATGDLQSAVAKRRSHLRAASKRANPAWRAATEIARPDEIGIAPCNVSQLEQEIIRHPGGVYVGAF